MIEFVHDVSPDSGSIVDGTYNDSILGERGLDSINVSNIDGAEDASEEGT
jgi:hypothetical protein